MPDIDITKTRELVERMKFARIGEYEKWQKIIKKIDNNLELSAEDIAYIANLQRTYDGKISSRSKIYHTKLSEQDEKPPCIQCGEESLFYCNMNDAYYCTSHVVGHDENEY